MQQSSWKSTPSFDKCFSLSFKSNIWKGIEITTYSLRINVIMYYVQVILQVLYNFCYDSYIYILMVRTIYFDVKTHNKAPWSWQFKQLNTMILSDWQSSRRCNVQSDWFSKTNCITSFSRCGENNRKT